MKPIQTNNAPAAIGPYSQGMEIAGLVFTSGQIGLDPATGKLAGESIEIQAEQVLKNLERQDKGMSAKDIANDLPLFANIKEKVIEKVSSPVLEELADINPDNLSPREALEKLYELKKML